jgi:branched-chain amino acid transport system substrate-binding protein
LRLDGSLPVAHRRRRTAPEASAACALALLGLLGSLGCRDGQAPIRIGVAGPFRNAPLDDNLRGAVMALEEANARGGVRGRHLEIVVGEDSGTGHRAAVVAEQFVQDPTVVAVVGHLSSSAMLSVAPLYDRGLAAVATMATAPELSGISPWVFRIASSDAVLGMDLARFAISNRWRRVAVLYQNDLYGRALASMFEIALEEAGGTVVASDPVSIQATTAGEFTVFMRTYALRRPDAILFITAPGLGRRVLRDAAMADLRIPIIGSDGWSPQQLAADPVAQGIYVPSLFLSDESDSAASAFRARFREKYGHEPGPYGATGYDAMTVVIAAITIAGPNRKGVRSALEATRLSPVSGVTGPISFLAGDRQQRLGGLVRIEGGVVKTHVRWRDLAVPP